MAASVAVVFPVLQCLYTSSSLFVTSFYLVAVAASVWQFQFSNANPSCFNLGLRETADWVHPGYTAVE